MTPRPKRRRPALLDWVSDHGIAHIKKRKYLAAFAMCGTHVQASKAAGVHRRSHYGWMKKDEAYAAAFAEAVTEACERLEAEAMRRGRDGWNEPVFQGGKKVGVIRRYSDTLLIFTLKGLMPERYRERYEHTGKDGGPIQLQPVVAKIETLTTEEIEQMRALAAKAQGHEKP